MEPEPALDVMDGFLYIVNLKNGYWHADAADRKRERAEWKYYWTSGTTGPGGLAARRGQAEARWATTGRSA